MKCISEEEYALLTIIAEQSRGLLARYPFDSQEEMKERWHNLGLYQAEYGELKRREARRG